MEKILLIFVAFLENTNFIWCDFMRFFLQLFSHKLLKASCFAFFRVISIGNLFQSKLSYLAFLMVFFWLLSNLPNEIKQRHQWIFKRLFTLVYFLIIIPISKSVHFIYFLIKRAELKLCQNKKGQMFVGMHHFWIQAADWNWKKRSIQTNIWHF